MARATGMTAGAGLACRAWLGALLFLTPPSPAAGVDPAAEAEIERWVRTNVQNSLERRHLQPDLIDADALVAVAQRRYAAEGMTAGLERWLSEEIRSARWAFAPLDAAPDPKTRYALPFNPVYPRFLDQGPGGRYSHQGRHYHAYDFVLPIGTPVRAARAGVVAQVVDGFTEGGPDPALGDFANHVYVLHPDGTFATYAHLDPGIPVREGQPVKRGQVIARSGMTGSAGSPHLHFEVLRNEPGGPRSVAVRFGRRGSRGYVPEQGAWIGNPPRPTVELTLFADDALVSRGTPVASRTGARMRIRAEIREPGRPPRDVTGHSRFELVSMTPWILDVAGPGEIVFRPMAGFPADEWGLDLDVVSVGAYFLNGKEGEIGLGKVDFRLADWPKVDAAEPPKDPATDRSTP